jgi:hypothetical protein
MFSASFARTASFSLISNSRRAASHASRDTTSGSPLSSMPVRRRGDRTFDIGRPTDSKTRRQRRASRRSPAAPVWYGKL